MLTMFFNDNFELGILKRLQELVYYIGQANL